MGAVIDTQATRTAALEYARKGWSVFPLATGLKVPRAGSSGFKDATIDPEVIHAWWSTNPTANLAIATGAVSGIDVIDVDGERGIASLRELMRCGPSFPTTYAVKTPRGLHLYLQHRPGVRSRANFRPGIDIRGDGGYVVAPPSIVGGCPYTRRPFDECFR